MKKIVLVGIMFMMFIGVVSASSINGVYEGNPVVKLLLDGKEIVADDVPAMIYNNRTIIPVYLLKKMGATVTWDLDSYSADIVLPKGAEKESLADIAKSMKKYGVDLINYMTDGEGIDTITYYTNFTSTEGLGKTTEYNAILESGMNTEATILEVYYTDKFAITIPTSSIRDFISGKITEKQFTDFHKYNMPIAQNKQSVTNVPTTSTQQPNTIGNAQPSVTPVPTSTPKPDNTAQCQAIRDKQVLEAFSQTQTGNPFGNLGRTKMERDAMEARFAAELAAAGC